MRRTLTIKRVGGFTLVELMTTIVIIGVFLPILAAIMIYSYQGAMEANRRVAATAQMKQALSFMDNDVKLATLFEAQVPSVFTDPYGFSNTGTDGSQAWSYKGLGNGARVLITRNVATTTNAGNTGRQLVYQDSPDSGFDCGAQNIRYEPVLPYITIYFLKDSTLYRRILTDTTSPLCPDNEQAQRQSCPPYLKSSWNSICEANDEVIATDIASFDVAYFALDSETGDGSSTPVDADYTSTDAKVLNPADYIVVSLTSTGGGGDTVYSMQQRITKVNQP